MMRLVTANLNYSSWSMRVWLTMRSANVPFKIFDVGLKTKADWKERILQFSGAGKVPVLIDGALSIHESLAICEYINEKYPEAQLWPADASLRARARAISSEMMSSFQELRSLLPCNIRGRTNFTPRSEALDAELRRVFDIWEASLATSSGGFLFGEKPGIADFMYTPVVFRLRSYAVPLSGAAAEYSHAILSLSLVKELEEIASRTESIAEFDDFLR